VDGIHVALRRCKVQRHPTILIRHIAIRSAGKKSLDCPHVASLRSPMKWQTAILVSRIHKCLAR